MKKLATLIILFLAALQVSAQDTSRVYNPGDYYINPTYAFSFEPFQMFTGGFFMGYDHLIKDGKVLRTELGVRLAEESLYYNASDVTEFNIELQYRNFVSYNMNQLSGVYVAPFLAFKGIGYRSDVIVDPQPGQTTFTSPGRSAQAASFGFVMGVQKVFPSGFLFDVNFGGGIQLPFGDYQELNDNFGAGSFSPYYKGIIPKGGLSFGVAF